MLKPAPETVDEADRDVKAPEAGAELPIGGGLANRLLKPEPEAVVLTVSVPTVAVVTPIEVAVSVVKAPVLGVPDPIGPGAVMKAVKPAPETAPLADRVVNAPEAGVPEPMDGGLAR